MKPASNRSFAMARCAVMVAACVLALAGTASAQHRSGGRGGGHGGYVVHGSGHYAPGHYNNGGHYAYYPYASYGLGFGYYPYAGYGLGFGYYPYFGGWNYPSYGYGGYYDPRGALRLEVKPDKAKVYVDGSYAGIVDDFDGRFQRLYLPPGRHRITVKLEGFKTHRWTVYAPSGNTLKLRYEMSQGTGEDAADDLAGSTSAGNRSERNENPRELVDRDPDVNRDEVSQMVAPAGVQLNVQPGDASVYVDGRFSGSAGQVRALQLPPGRHRIEVVRPGFRTFSRDVDIEASHTVDLEIAMEKR